METKFCPCCHKNIAAFNKVCPFCNIDLTKDDMSVVEIHQEKLKQVLKNSDNIDISNSEK